MEEEEAVEGNGMEENQKTSCRDPIKGGVGRKKRQRVGGSNARPAPRTSHGGGKQVRFFISRRTRSVALLTRLIVLLYSWVCWWERK